MEEFIQRIKKELDKGINIINVKSKEIIETIRINNQIGNLNDQKHRIFEEIGQIVYKMSQAKEYDGTDAIKDKCRQLTELEAEIANKEVELTNIGFETKEAYGKIICESCGTVMETESKYCSNCGARLIKVEK